MKTETNPGHNTSQLEQNRKELPLFFLVVVVQFIIHMILKMASGAFVGLNQSYTDYFPLMAKTSFYASVVIGLAFALLIKKRLYGGLIERLKLEWRGVSFSPGFAFNLIAAALVVVVAINGYIFAEDFTDDRGIPLWMRIAGAVLWSIWDCVVLFGMWQRYFLKYSYRVNALAAMLAPIAAIWATVFMLVTLDAADVPVTFPQVLFKSIDAVRYSATMILCAIAYKKSGSLWWVLGLMLILDLAGILSALF